MTKPKAAAVEPGAGSVFNRAFERTTSAGEGVPRLKATFTMPAAACAPGVFDEDFDVTVGALTSALEVRAAQAAKGDPTSLGLHMARLSVLAVDGVPLSPDSARGEWFWEALGQTGRMLVVAMFSKVGVPQDDQQGKVEATRRLG